MSVKSILLLTVCFFLFTTSSKSKNSENFKVTSELSLKRFIENKGQFDGRNSINQSKILYAVDHGGIQIYFTKEGVSYNFFQSKKNYLRKKGEKDVPRMLSKSDQVHIGWVNASPNVTIIAEEVTDDYHTYMVKTGENSYADIEKVSGYKKLIYKNLYDGIDAEYVFHETEGLKYSFIVKPGADISKIKMQFDSDKKLSIDEAGNLHIKTEFGDIIDHAPQSFYQNQTKKIIGSAFAVNGNTVSFTLKKYDNTKAIVIDPWTVTPSAFSNSNKIFNIETDQNSNVYVYGGDSPMRLRKYSAAGALVWTYNTPWDTTTYWIGSLKTDLAGNSYITSGTRGSIRKINTGGTMDWESANSGPFPEVEFWSLDFNCDYTRMFCAGMRSPNGLQTTAYRGTVFELSMTNGNILGFREVGVTLTTGDPRPNEARSIAHSPNGKLYYLMLDSIGVMTSGLTVQSQINNSYNFSYGNPNFGVTVQGVNAIAASENFVYTVNGTTLHKRSIANNVILASVAIPSGNATSIPIGAPGNLMGNDGIALDDCENIYVGSTNGVYKFSSNLAPLGSFTTPAAVYDVAINYNGEVVATGNNFIISNNTLSACIPVPTVCLNCLELTPAGPFCPTDAPVNLVSNNQGGTWSGPGITNASAGTFSPAAAGPGSHLIRYVPNPALTCGIDTMRIIVDNCAQLTVCKNANGSLTVSGGFAPYTWERDSTFLDCSGCPFGQCFPLVCPGINRTVAVTIGTSSTLPAPSTFPVRVKDNAGNELVITNASSLPNCNTTVCPTITVTVSTQTNVACAGGNNGSATVSASGGATPYTYTWQPGNVTGATRNNLTAGTYTVVASDANACSGTVTVTITAPLAITLTTSTTPATCSGNTGTAGVTVTNGTLPYTFLWSNGATTQNINSLASGSYTVTVRDNNNCTASASVNVSSSGGATVTLNAKTDITCFGGKTGAIDVNVTGGTTPYTYLWSNNESTQDISFLAGGTYTVTVRDNNNCQTVFSATINEPTALVVAGNSTNPGCGANDGSITVSVNGGTTPYIFNWSNGATSQSLTNIGAGNFRITVTDNNGCADSLSFTLTSPGGISVALSATDASCEGVNNGIVNATITGGAVPYTYSWSNGATTQSITSVGPGNYTLTVTDALSCTEVQVATVAALNSINLAANITGVQCEDDNLGAIKLITTGGTAPYVITWANGTLGETVTQLTAGSYAVTVVDANGCTTDSVFVLQSLSGLNINASATGLSCDGSAIGSAQVLVTGNQPPYTYSWSNGATTQTISSLSVGSYFLTVTDDLGCIALDTVAISVASISVLEKNLTQPECDTTLDGAIEIILVSGNTDITFEWDNGQDSSTAVNLSAGNYTVTITNEYNCTLIDTTILTAERVCNDTLIIYDVFSPNGDGKNDLWVIDGLANYPNNELEIYNRWGSMVFEQKPYTNGWDGSNKKGDPLPSATYYYILKLNDGTDKVYSGHVTIIR
jgi:gliding motility-associated-like protein